MRVQRGESLQAYNTLGLESRARELVTATTADELTAACRRAVEHGLPLVPLGEGSNVVLAADLDALVLRVATRGIEVLERAAETVTLRVAAGENWHALVEWTLGQGFFGLENLALIPGTVGAAPIQNIGAYGVELQSVLQAVHALQAPALKHNDAIDAHMGDCPPCQAFLESLRRTIRWVGDSGVDELPAELRRDLVRAAESVHRKG